MNKTLKVMDDMGVVTVTYEEMKKYHDQDFLGGVALAFKVLELAFRELLEGEVPRRDKIRLVLGHNPPGLVDGFEYVTRAITRQRAIFDPTISKGLPSAYGRFYFEVHYEKKKIVMWLKDNLLPDDFLEVSRKCRGGLASKEEQGRLKDYKIELGNTIIEKDPEEVLEIGELIK